MRVIDDLLIKWMMREIFSAPTWVKVLTDELRRSLREERRAMNRDLPALDRQLANRDRWEARPGLSMQAAPVGRAENEPSPALLRKRSARPHSLRGVLRADQRISLTRCTPRFRNRL